MSRTRTDRAEKRAVRYGLVAAALLALEFIAGMQTYVLHTVLPIVGAEFDAHEYYGVITGTAEVSMFVTMPLGPYLLQRFRVDRLLLVLTSVTVAGAFVSAVAPSVGIFVLGRAFAGLAAGALSTVSLAAIVTVLPATWRRAVLAGYAAMWVITSLIGPAYAGWVASALSWRWTLLLYLPLLVVARIVVARELKGSMQTGGDQERLTLGSAFALAGGVALLSLVGMRGVPPGFAVVLGAFGVTAVFLAAQRLLPAGTFIVRPGRPAAVATMGLVTGAYFGAAGIIAIIVHDLLDGTAGEIAVVLAGSGLAWAVAGLAVSRWPAQAERVYVRRSTLAAGILAAGLVTTGAAVLADGVTFRFELVLIGWTVAGVGMGMVYLDTLNHIVEVPSEVDGVSPKQAAAYAVLVEAVATAVMITLATALVGRAVAGGGGEAAAALVLAATVAMAVCVAVAARRVVAAETPR